MSWAFRKGWGFHISSCSPSSPHHVYTPPPPPTRRISPWACKTRSIRCAACFSPCVLESRAPPRCWCGDHGLPFVFWGAVCNSGKRSLSKGRPFPVCVVFSGLGGFSDFPGLSGFSGFSQQWGAVPIQNGIFRLANSPISFFRTVVISFFLVFPVFCNRNSGRRSLSKQRIFPVRFGFSGLGGFSD